MTKVTGLYTLGQVAALNSCFYRLCLLAIPLLLSGCDPLLSIQGSFWPPWIMSMLAGLVLCVVLLRLLDRYGLGADFGPVLISYPCLWCWLTFSVWLLAFG